MLGSPFIIKFVIDCLPLGGRTLVVGFSSKVDGDGLFDTSRGVVSFTFITELTSC